MAEITGGCLCGAVRYSAVAEPERVGICHCLDCRKVSGGVLNVFATFPADRVTVTGETRLTPAGRAPGRRFCPRCGSPVFSHAEGSGEIEIHVGSFDEPGRVVPGYELWIGRREPWLPEIPVSCATSATGPPAGGPGP
ncbi:MAG: GFA family protein [Dongiaceae bacterium]